MFWSVFEQQLIQRKKVNKLYSQELRIFELNWVIWISKVTQDSTSNLLSYILTIKLGYKFLLQLNPCKLASATLRQAVSYKLTPVQYR